MVEVRIGRRVIDGYIAAFSQLCMLIGQMHGPAHLERSEDTERVLEPEEVMQSNVIRSGVQNIPRRFHAPRYTE